MDYPKLISEKWNLTAKFNCLQAIYFDAPSALAVPMCGLDRHYLHRSDELSETAAGNNIRVYVIPVGSTKGLYWHVLTTEISLYMQSKNKNNGVHSRLI